MKDKMGNNQLYKNIFMNVSAFLVQFVISFYISPVIVKGVGGPSAYGFIGLANEFVSYATIITSVFNSVAARFIAKAFYEEDYEKANRYFNSLIVTNLILAGVFSVISIVIVPNLDIIISIPADIMFDVKLTFALTFSSYIITLVTTVFTTSTFVSNRTDIQGIRNIIQYIIRFALIIVFFNFISIKLYWISCSALVATIVVAIMNVRLTKILTPEIHFDLRKAKRKYAFTLAKSGCWMALTSISTILLRGLDLTIANVLLGDYDMGNRVVEYAKNLKPSARGELEITDLNRIYLEDGSLNVELLGQGFTWLDTGTHESLVEATNFVKTVESHQHRKIACLEEIAYLNGWITKDDVLAVYEELKKNQYGQYLKDVLDGKYLDVLR